jgi:hypothetical protein
VKTNVKIKKQKKESGFEEIKEIKSICDVIECNHLLATGWELLHAGGQHMDQNGFNAKPLFILGKKK